MNPVLFLTACINPKGMVNTAIQNVNIRRKQYYEALKYYIYNTDYRIVFVDNSGYDISPDFIKYINEGRLEVITIDNNNFNKKLGKGYGEWLIIYHGILNSKFINKDSIIIKVTGRHIIKNINAIYSMTKTASNSKSFVCCDINNKSKSGISDCFIATYNFFVLFATKYITLINESNNIWFEHALYKAIIDFCKKNEFIFLPLPLNQKGCSGSTGEKFSRPSISRYLKHIIKYILYYFGLIKLSH